VLRSTNEVEREEPTLSVRTPSAGVAPVEQSSSLREYHRLKPGRSQSQPDVIASQRFRLRRALVELTAREGFDAVTVRKLTKAAGVSSRAFYARFSGVDDCLLSAYGSVMADAAERLIATRALGLEPGDQAERTVRALVRHLLADRDVARFALIEVYAGGPAALAAIGGEERRLEAVLRGCLDRRAHRISRTMAAALLAASLRCVRVQLLLDRPEREARPALDALVAWARDLVEDREELGVSTVAVSASAVAGPIWEHGKAAPGERDEEDLLLSALLRLALPDGFHSLTSSKVSAVAGLPAARFRRHFADLAEGYLAAIRRTCGSFFVELTADGSADPAARVPIRAALHRASRRAATDPAAARLTFKRVVEPGIAGLTCRESLISELAQACQEKMAAPGGRSSPLRAEASVAAFWATLAETAQARSLPA
jgi:AcrR family transcriptional regulator